MERHTHHGPFHRNKNQIQTSLVSREDDLFLSLAKNTNQIEKLPLFKKISLAFSYHLNDDFDKISTPFKTI
jgi:hypothetical protein